ncbi:MAG TPA: hypothetical protein PKH07_19195 [bacterium]|nr:hypothetical protein [bacterium]
MNELSQAEFLSGLFQSDSELKDVKIFSYRRDFSFLWGLDASSEFDLKTAKGLFVVVWDGMPESDSRGEVIDTAQYLTPFDWAVSAYLHAGEVPPDWKILIYKTINDDESAPAFDVLGHFSGQ